jgi:transcriptional antiterminator RfaH
VPWYVLYTKPNSESKISQHLVIKGINSYCPQVAEIRQWSDRKKRILRPLFKSYVFVNLSDYSHDSKSVLQIPGSVKFIWWSGKPGIVRDSEIEQIRNFLRLYKNSTIALESSLNMGDPVDITTGPLSGLTGKIVSIRGRKVVLELETLRCRLIAEMHKEVTVDPMH